MANKATELGETLNKQLKPPSEVSRNRTLNMDNDANASDKIVTFDPYDPINVNILNSIIDLTIIHHNKIYLINF